MSNNLNGKTILITAGPTQEAIDPVRFITNKSSGKMGYALAQCARDRGAQVILISGPVSLEPPEGVKVINVVSAQEMFDAAVERFSEADVAICTAAVCDFRPRVAHDRKLKKLIDGDSLSNIELEPTPDILKYLCEIKKQNQTVIGFAAETNDLKMNAAEKLTLKNADYIIANDVSNDSVFGSDKNKVSILSVKGISEYPELPKPQVAGIVLDLL